MSALVLRQKLMLVRAPTTVASFWPATLPPGWKMYWKSGCNDPAGIDLEGVADFDQRLVIARHRLAEIDVEGRDLVGDAGIGEADGERVVRAGCGIMPVKVTPPSK